MKKIFMIFCGLFIGATQFSNAQVEFMHSLGISLYSAGDAGGAGITYSPRLNIIKVGDDGAISIGTHLSLGISLNSQDASGNSLVADFPILAEINLGNGATKDGDKSFGFFGGLGYGFSAVASANGSNSAAGPVVDAGIRFVLAEKLPLGLRVSYLITSTAGSSSVLGLGISYNFGVLK